MFVEKARSLVVATVIAGCVCSFGFVDEAENVVNVGDRVSVKQQASLMAGEEVRETLEVGTELLVLKLTKSWAGVTDANEGTRVKGWVLRKHLEPVPSEQDAEGATSPPDLPPAEDAAGDSKKSVHFKSSDLTFAVPSGWELVEFKELKDHGWCVLKKEKESAWGVTATIGVWCGQKYISESPASGIIKSGNAVAACGWANQKALAWGVGAPDKKPPRTSSRGFTMYKYGGLNYIGIPSENDKIFTLGVCASSREGGAITAGCACPRDPVSMKMTKNALATILAEGHEE